VPPCTRAEEQGAWPAEAVAASLGCGNPLVGAEVQEGESVLDLGFGGGIDVVLSASRVGRYGFVHPVDVTDDMRDLARRVAHPCPQQALASAGPRAAG
jgi:arsenite methyltransferase